MDVFLMIRRKKLTIFTDCKDSTSVLELKKIVEGILKIAPENQRLFKDNIVMEDDKTLQEYGLVPNVARAQCPAPLGLALKLEPDGDFEPLEITPLSSPPDLPDVMKVPETNGQEQRFTFHCGLRNVMKTFKKKIFISLPKAKRAVHPSLTLSGISVPYGLVLMPVKRKYRK